MDIQQLKYFQAIVVHERLTYAAKKMHISEPALSLSLRRLENELGVELFDRVGRNIVVNEYGKIFNKHVNEILYILDNARSEIEMLAGKDSNTVTICWNYTGSMEKIMLQFINENPHITINQYRVPEEIIGDELLKSYCDFVIVETANLEDYPYEKLLFPDVEWFLAIPADHKLASVPSPKLAQFADDPFSAISLTPGHSAMTQRLCEHAGFVCKIAYKATPSVCISLVVDKKCLTFVRSEMAKIVETSSLYSDKIRFVPLSAEDYVVHTALLWNGKKKLSKAAQEFLDYMHIPQTI